MRVPNNHILAVTYELAATDFALDAVYHLAGNDTLSAVTGLIEVVYEPVAASVAVEAVDALAQIGNGHPLSDKIFAAYLHGALRSESTVQISCIRKLQHRQDTRATDLLKTILATCPKWIIRRAALRALLDIAPAAAAIAATDPHWRVRHALVERLTEDRDLHLRLLQAIRGFRDNERADGVASYLMGRDAVPYESISPLASQPFWDTDSSVFFRELKSLPNATVLKADNTLMLLLAHSDERIRKWAAKKMRSHGEIRHLRCLVDLLREPRLPAAVAARDIIRRLDAARYEQLLHYCSELPDFLIETCSTEPPPWQARTTKMTSEEAAAIVANPTAEASWRVIRHAAKLTRTPLWNIEPAERWKPIEQAAELHQRKQNGDVGEAFKLPEEPRDLPLLAISGHYGLPEAGFHMAYHAGINLMFWEPNYNSMTGFFRRTNPAMRCDIRLMAGTFEADAAGIRRDVDQVLRLLNIERVYFFMMFWVKTWKRIDDEVRRTLEELVSEGKVYTYGLSTHNYGLAIDAIQADWNPVMVRHNAAHRGAEENVFAEAAQRNTTVVAFNNTCYGRLLGSVLNRSDSSTAENGSGVTASDCYRFSLEQRGVTACLTAPADMAQLRENLTVLKSPELPVKRKKLLLETGRKVRREDKRFREQVRYR